MTEREALKLALEALEEFGEHYDWCHQFPTYAFPENYPPCNCGYDEAITAIKEALAQPEKDGVALTNIPHPNGTPAPDDLNADALEVVELELPDEDEAVGWADGGVINWIAGKQFKHASYLYATPPQRTWVGLTDDELQPIADAYRILFGSWVKDFAQAIEAKLKEKNSA